MLDINLFRNTPEIVRKSVRRRFKDVSLVDEIIDLDQQWRKAQFELSNLQKQLKKNNQEIGNLKRLGEDVTEKIKSTKQNRKLASEEKVEFQKAKADLDSRLATLGNLEHHSASISIIDKENNAEVCLRLPKSKNYDELVERLVHLLESDKQWSQRQLELGNLQKDPNNDKCDEDESEKIRRLTAEKKVEVQNTKELLDKKLATIGNIVDDSVPTSIDEENNAEILVCGEKRMGPNLKNQFELVNLLGIADFIKGANVAGGRGYFLVGNGELLNKALIYFGYAFLDGCGYKLMGTPSLMRQDMMGKCAQLSQFEEELYQVTGEGDDKYLIATAEQPLCAFHLNDHIHPSELPIRYAGHSKCFRKEAGSHGRDTLGLFRTHEFDKVEQFCITSPNDNESSKMFDKMIKNSEKFYQALKIPYRVVSIVSGALNDAAAKKYDLEGWFPASQTYRELVSCSNCTDYQSRTLGIRYGHASKKTDKAKQYVHLLNCTLTATERTICCILENYQKEDGVEIPAVLQPYMNGCTFLPFQTSPRRETEKEKDIKNLNPENG